MTKCFNSIISNLDDNNSEKRGISMHILIHEPYSAKIPVLVVTPLRKERDSSLLWPAILISIAALLIVTLLPVQENSICPEARTFPCTLGGTNEFSPGTGSPACGGC